MSHGAERDYSKDTMKRISYGEAMDAVEEGYVVSRQAWPAGSIVFKAREGTFVAADLVTGYLEPFLVCRLVTGRYTVWSPTNVDTQMRDWLAVSRATFQRTAQERHIKWDQDDQEKPAKTLPETYIPWKDVRIGDAD